MQASNPSESFLRKMITVVEQDFDEVLNELEARNLKQLEQMEIIKNMVNECIRELFENFEIDIEETYMDRKVSLSSKLHSAFKENLEKIEFKTEENTKLNVSSKLKREKTNSENIIKADKNSENERSIKSETQNIEEIKIHDMSFSINQSHDVKNDNMKENLGNRNKIKTLKSTEINEQIEQNLEKIEKHLEKNSDNQNTKKQEKNTENEKIVKLIQKTEKNHNETFKSEKKFNPIRKENNAEKVVEKAEKIKKIEPDLVKPEKLKKVCESDQKLKTKKIKDKAFRSYIAPYSGTSKTIQELINNSNCKKLAQQNLNDPTPSNPSNPSSQIIKMPEKISKNFFYSDTEQINEKNPQKSQKCKEKNEEPFHTKENKIDEIKPKILLEFHTSHTRNKSEDILLKKNNELKDFKKKTQENLTIDIKKEDKNSKSDYSLEKTKEISPNLKRNPLVQNKFLNYYYFFEDKKDIK